MNSSVVSLDPALIAFRAAKPPQSRVPFIVWQAHRGVVSFPANFLDFFFHRVSAVVLAKHKTGLRQFAGKLPKL